MASEQVAEKKIDWNAVAAKAKGRALRGGAAGMAAMVLNVSTLMWMRTTINFQYRTGASPFEAFRRIYAEGGGGVRGIMRFYAGYPVAIVMGPLARFGDTAANEGVKAILNATAPDLPVFAKTCASTLAASGWRIVIMPIDACKTIMQVEGGKKGLTTLAAKVRAGGPGVLWHGALGACSASIVGNLPWWSTYNYLDTKLPEYKEDKMKRLGRNAFMGFSASIVSDTCSNSLKVVKTYKQTSPVPISYKTAIQEVVAADGWIGLFGRGLVTKWAANGFQAAMFSVAFKSIKDKFDALFEGEAE